MGGETIFSKIDLTARYNQVRIHEAEIPKTTFWTKYGAYESLIMNFGLPNTPSTFATLMNLIFTKDLGKYVIFYLDYIIVFIKNEEQHLFDLRKTLNTLRYNNLYAKPSKY